ncbi:MAG: CPBP family intramembrane metalloprotease, partial [Deltaproteobacteria bacterium]
LDIVIVSVCAGVVEEALFRGVLQEELGIVWASLLFGLAHAIAFELVVWITGIGFLLGWLFAQTGDIATVMICHGVYDALVIYYMRRHYRPPCV